MGFSFSLVCYSGGALHSNISYWLLVIISYLRYKHNSNLNITVGPQYGTRFASKFWRLELWCGSKIFFWKICATALYDQISYLRRKLSKIRTKIQGKFHFERQSVHFVKPTFQPYLHFFFSTPPLNLVISLLAKSNGCRRRECQN
jgi:hypothetical protein